MAAARNRPRTVLAAVGAAVLLVVWGIWFWQVRPVASPVRITPLGWEAVAHLVAGDGHRGLRDGERLAARFDEPWGLVRDGWNGVFIADAGNANRLRWLGLDGQVRTVAGSSEGWRDGPADQARFHTPSGLDLGPDRALYIADTGNHAIRVLRDGQVTTLVGNGVAGGGEGDPHQSRLDGPMDVAVDADGTVFIADTWNDRIAVLGADGRLRTLAGDGTPGLVDGPGSSARFDTPTGISLHPDGSLWVADLGNHAIRRVHRDGRVDTLVGQEGERRLWQPLSLAIADDGHAYVAERSSGRVLQLSSQGHLLAVYGQDSQDRLSRPAGLVTMPGGGLLVADAGGARLHWLHPARQGQTPNTAVGAIGPAPDRALPATGGRWPLAPQNGWHEVVGTLGEVRGTFAGKNRNHLHAGFDVRGEVGQPVLALADGKVSSPMAAWSPNGQAEGLALDDLDYIHMRVGRTPNGQPLDARFALLRDERGRVERVRIRRGTRFAAGEPLGTINNQAHVHLQVGPGGYERNAIGLGFVNFTDTVAPVVEQISLLDADEQPLPRQADGSYRLPRTLGAVQVAVHARDQVDGNLPRRRLGLYALGWQVLDAAGRPLPGFEAPVMNLEFNRMPPQRDAVLHAYGPESGITVHGSAVTRFQYLVTNTVRDGRLAPGRWEVSTLAPGTYTIVVHARDWHGNAAVGNNQLQVVIAAPSDAS